MVSMNAVVSQPPVAAVMLNSCISAGNETVSTVSLKIITNAAKASEPMIATRRPRVSRGCDGRAPVREGAVCVVMCAGTCLSKICERSIVTQSAIFS